MGDGLRTIHLVTTDESLLAGTRGAVGGLDGWEFRDRRSVAELTENPPVAGDVILLDAGLRDRNVYESCRSLTGRTRCRTFVVVQEDNRWAAPIAQFSGATGVLERPLSAGALREALEKSAGPRPGLPQEERGQQSPEAVLPEALLQALTSGSNSPLIEAMTDPETGLLCYDYLKYKLDEEYKRATRFGHPLSCLMLGFEGQASESVLQELASIFLQSSRDTDVLGRFDESSFLFLLPHTGPDGAEVMGRRVGELAQAKGLRDLVGDPLQIAVGISFFPQAGVQRREDLFGSTRKAFEEARAAGGGVVTAT